MTIYGDKVCLITRARRELNDVGTTTSNGIIERGTDIPSTA